MVNRTISKAGWHLLAWALCLSTVLLPQLLHAAATEAKLVLGVETVRPGSSFLGGLRLKMEKGWHTYWRNPGASGMATSIEWKLPDGITAGAIQWPVPHILPEEDLTTYVYEDEVVLLIPFQVDAKVKPGSYTLKGEASWLECKVQCLPGNSSVEHTLAVADASKPSPQADLLKTWQQKLPADPAALAVKASWESATTNAARVLFIDLKPSGDHGTNVNFLPYENDAYEVQAPVAVVSSTPEKIRLRKEIKRLGDKWPETISGILVFGKEPAQKAYDVTLQPSAPTASTPIPAPTTQLPLWLVLIYALIGGLILNIMPCVLPVIALKILGFVTQSKDEPGRVRRMGLVYGLGVWVSFLVMAGLIIAVKIAGHSAGWGMQFGNPMFLVVLTVIMTLVALNLFGLFEITPGAKVLDTAGNLASHEGYPGAFFNGALATVLATPCTAPFLGVALGYAMAQGTGTILLVFSVVALGLASPYVVLSWHPAWLKFLPKPGPWMERFKILMGFPMLATAAWLYSLTPTHYGSRSWYLVMFLVFVALAAWVFGEFTQRARRAPMVSTLIALGVLAVGYVVILEGKLDWRSPSSDTTSSSLPDANKHGIAWEPWSTVAVAKARSDGRPVLVDFTADWCLTCQANKKFAIEIPQVIARLKEINAVPLLGDYTKLPPAITAELNRFGRAGVPLVLVYPKATNKAPIVLPEALTPGMVMDALSSAVQ